MLCIEMVALLVTAVSAEGNRKVPKQLNRIGKFKNILFCLFFCNRKIASKNKLLNIWACIKVELCIIYNKGVHQILFYFFHVLFDWTRIGMGCKVFCHIEVKKKYIQNNLLFYCNLLNLFSFIYDFSYIRAHFFLKD